MIQNLRIIGITINSDNSDIVSGSYTIPNETSAQNGGYTDLAYYRSGSCYDPNYNSGYYSQYTATAGTLNTSTSLIAQNSICPKKWKLPSPDDYSTLLSKYGSNSSRLSARPSPNFTYCSHCEGSGSNDRKGTFGWYWTSSFQIDFDFSSSNPNVHTNGNANGFAIRCVFR